MQAKLPDVNARLVRYLNSAQNAYDRNDFAKAAIAFDSSNSCLPEDYQVKIDTKKYYELIKPKHSLVCGFCKATFERATVKPYLVLLTKMDFLISGKKEMIVIDCPHCQKTQALEFIEREVQQFEEPFFTGYIPEPPRREGFHDRTGFIRKFREWFEIVCHELEKKISEYRRDYAEQQDEIIEGGLPDE